MAYELPNPANPFKDDQLELAMAWELGYMKREESIIQGHVETARWAVHFRQEIRNALAPYYVSNPCSTDNELIKAVRELADYYGKGK